MPRLTWLFSTRNSYHRPNLCENISAFVIESSNLIDDLLRGAVHYHVPSVRVLGRKVQPLSLYTLPVDAPTLQRISKLPLQFHKLRQILIIQRIRLPQTPARLQLVIPNFPRLLALLKKQDHRLDACTLEGPLRAVQ